MGLTCFKFQLETARVHAIVSNKYYVTELTSLAVVVAVASSVSLQPLSCECLIGVDTEK